MQIVHELPEHVELSQHLRDKSPFFLVVQLLGITYYIAATPTVRRLLELDEKGKTEKPDRRRRWDRYKMEDALRDIINSLHLQVRDVVLAGIEQNVTETLLAKMQEAMRPTVRKAIHARTEVRWPALTQGETSEPASTKKSSP